MWVTSARFCPESPRTRVFLFALHGMLCTITVFVHYFRFFLSLASGLSISSSRLFGLELQGSISVIRKGLLWGAAASSLYNICRAANVNVIKDTERSLGIMIAALQSFNTPSSNALHVYYVSKADFLSGIEVSFASLPRERPVSYCDENRGAAESPGCSCADNSP